MTAKELSVFKGGIKTKPLGALVMTSFAEIHAPIEKVREAEKAFGVALDIRAPIASDALALVMRNVDTLLAELIADDRKRIPGAERFTWRAKRTGANEYVVHRVALVKAEQGRLQQPNVARVWMTPGTSMVQVQVLDGRVFTEKRALELIRKHVEAWQKFVNSQRVRLAWMDLLRTLRAVPYMPRGIGGVNFVPREGLEQVAQFKKFMDEMAKYVITDWDFALRVVDVWDTDEVRRELLKDVENEVNKRLDELAEKVARDVLEARDAKRLERILERRVAQKAEAMKTTSTYEDLLRGSVMLRERLIEPKLLAAAEKRFDDTKSGEPLSERARALFKDILSKEARASISISVPKVRRIRKAKAVD